ncbi:MAG: aminodeoxychorismate/anthranilate synthase component II [Bacteroidota bacterium]|nr:aminodeoxychorismate/anthranilate synthase component II [Bacteroidota bacterium]
MKILILDNYDSFTYNLVHIVRKLGFTDLDIIRNDKIAVSEVDKYDKIILSPGPGIPVEAGIMMDLIKTYSNKKSILGVCLGHQAIGESFGGELYNVQKVIHGKALNTKIIANDPIFKGLPTEFKTGRYHSWAIRANNLPAHLEATAIDESGVLMALRHKTLNVKGVQFHPESVMTEFGELMMKNWLEE